MTFDLELREREHEKGIIQKSVYRVNSIAKGRRMSDSSRTMS